MVNQTYKLFVHLVVIDDRFSDHLGGQKTGEFIISDQDWLNYRMSVIIGNIG